MIINALLDIVYHIIDFFMLFDLPGLPEGFTKYVNDIGDYLAIGARIVNCYAPLGYLLSLMGFIILIDVGIIGYKIVMWIARKIPFAGIS